MSKIVSYRMDVFQGNEVRVPVTCCQDAKWRIEESFRIVDIARQLFDAILPTAYGHLLVVHADGPFKIKYCPTCGDEIKEKEK